MTTINQGGLPGADSCIIRDAVFSLSEHTLYLRTGVAQGRLEVVLLVDEVAVNPLPSQGFNT